jgi:hypothetical protein
MYPKLHPEPVYVDINSRVYKTPRDKIAAAYAGAIAFKECLIWELSAILGVTTFKEQYDKAMPACITAANQVGLSATVDTLEYHNPGKGLEIFIKDKLEHKDNPFYPFFEEL